MTAKTGPIHLSSFVEIASPSTVARSVIHEILNIVRWPLASLDSHLFSINSCPAIDK